jgi:preprotein translocase subunit SecG
MPTFLSGISSGLRKFLTKDRVIVLVGFIVLAIVFMYYSTGKITVRDGMKEGKAQVPSTDAKKNTDASNDTAPQETQAAAASVAAKESFQGYSEKEVANPSELLPNDENSQWSSLNPVSQSNPQMPDMLQAGYHIGLDTIGQTMKNANLQLRSDPVIQKGEIGPWNQSTIEPDLMRVPLEVGCSTDK